MAKSVVQEVKEEVTVEKATLPKRIHINEYLSTMKLDSVQKAGIVALAGVKVWRTPAQWEFFMKNTKGGVNNG